MVLKAKTIDTGGGGGDSDGDGNGDGLQPLAILVAALLDEPRELLADRQVANQMGSDLRGRVDRLRLIGGGGRKNRSNQPPGDVSGVVWRQIQETIGQLRREVRKAEARADEGGGEGDGEGEGEGEGDVDFFEEDQKEAGVANRGNSRSLAQEEDQYVIGG